MLLNSIIHARPCVGPSLQYDRVPDRMDDYYFAPGIRRIGNSIALVRAGVWKVGAELVRQGTNESRDLVIVTAHDQITFPVTRHCSIFRLSGSFYVGVWYAPFFFRTYTQLNRRLLP
jgi:hypothetical protein